MGFFQRPYRFGIFYGLVLAAAVGAILLETFVIPRGYASVSPESVSLTTLSGSQTTPEVSFITLEPEETDTTAAEATPVVTAEDTTYAPIVTDTSYDDGSLKITLETLRAYDTDIYLVHVSITDITQLQTVFAQDTYGRNMKETTSSMAARSNALLAINGDYYGFRSRGFVLRNGVLYRDTSGGGQALAIMEDGSFRIVEEDTADSAVLLAEGAWQILSFGPVLVENGAVAVSASAEVGQAMTSNPRTAIGILSPMEYLLVVSDGRTSASAGLSLAELAAIMAEQGCETAYNLDGGGSSTLWFNGQIINNPTDGSGTGERKVSDIVCFCA